MLRTLNSFKYCVPLSQARCVALRSTFSSSITSTDSIDPYDLKRIRYQNKIGINTDDILYEEDVKNGNDLRKARKTEQVAKRQKVEATRALISKKASKSKVSIPKRFVLGNGVEGLTSETLINLVYSTAP